MRLEGWNHIPEGYGASFDVRSAPRWLRIWFRTPLLDRWAYPQLVRRGLGLLAAHPDVPAEQRGEITGGWRLAPENERPPGSATELR